MDIYIYMYICMRVCVCGAVGMSKYDSYNIYVQRYYNSLRIQNDEAKINGQRMAMWAMKS